MGSEVYTQKERFPESVTIASGDRLGGLPDVVHKREKMVVRVCYGRGCWQAVGLPGSVAQAGAGVFSQAVRSAGSPFLLRQLHPPLGLLVEQLVDFIVTFAPLGEVLGRAFAHRHLLFEDLLLDFHIGDVSLQGF